MQAPLRNDLITLDQRLAGFGNCLLGIQRAILSLPHDNFRPVGSSAADCLRLVLSLRKLGCARAHLGADISRELEILTASGEFAAAKKEGLLAEPFGLLTAYRSSVRQQK
jgi:hypothetical protein